MLLTPRACPSDATSKPARVLLTAQPPGLVLGRRTSAMGGVGRNGGDRGGLAHIVQDLLPPWRDHGDDAE
jgi:hypothetical protein